MVHEGGRLEGDGTSGKQAPQFPFTPPSFQEERGMIHRLKVDGSIFCPDPPHPLSSGHKESW